MLRLPAARGSDVFSRFWRRVKRRVVRGRVHWIYTGSKDRDGYGQVKTRTRLWRAHRFAYEQLVAPTELHLDHTCNVRACVYPGHLEPVTHQENCRRRDERRRAWR